MIILACFSVKAQDIKPGQFSVGANIVWGTGVQMVGAGAYAQYIPFDNVRAEVGMNYFFEGNWDLNINAHYMFSLFNSNFYLYPLAGFCLANLDTNLDDPTESRIRKMGMNVGGGAEYRLKNDVAFRLEFRRTIMPTIHQSVIGGGVAITF